MGTGEGEKDRNNLGMVVYFIANPQFCFISFPFQVPQVPQLFNAEVVLDSFTFVRIENPFDFKDNQYYPDVSKPFVCSTSIIIP